MNNGWTPNDFSIPTFIIIRESELSAFFLMVIQGQRNVFEPGADKTKSPTMPVAAQNVPFRKFLNLCSTLM